MNQYEILAAVAKAFRLSTDILLSKKRSARIALARQVTMYLMREHTTLSTVEIGAFLGRDHSTVIHGWKVIAMRTARDAHFATTIRAIGVYSSEMDKVPWQDRHPFDQGCLA